MLMEQSDVEDSVFRNESLLHLPPFSVAAQCQKKNKKNTQNPVKSLQLGQISNHF